MQHHLGLDVGKTGLRVGLYDRDLCLLERWSYPTADVVKVQDLLASRLGRLASDYEIGSAGVSIFGPLQVNPACADLGAVIESSEPAWSGVNVPQLAASVLKQDVWFDFDVNAGALAEADLGAGAGKSSFVYLSIGTGIGEVHVSGSHRPGYAPQTGHMYIPREADDSTFEGSCRFHGTCLQGLASGKAMAQRWGQPAELLGGNRQAWDLEARYLARACANLVYTFAPEVILLGSSVGAAADLSMVDVNRYLSSMLNDFLEPELRVRYNRESAVIRASLGADASLVGAALLGRMALGVPYRWRL